MSEPFSYKKSGVDIDTADATKREMAESLSAADSRVLNRIGAFASLFEASFPGYEEPVLMLKTEEPGSKQKLAFRHGYVDSLCYDLVNHLVNDIIVMGAEPLSVQDCIVCGKLESETVKRIVAGIAAAAREQGATLTGGETSEQPGVIEPGMYILTASIVGVAEKKKIVDGSAIREGDAVIAVASNGLHTNGYSLVRALLDRDPSIAKLPVGGMSFLESIMLPHTCYYKAVRGLFGDPALHGMAHITGGGIRDNLRRIIPEGLSARIRLPAVKLLPVFGTIKKIGAVDDADMLRTFNLGVGLTVVADAGSAGRVIEQISAQGYEAYVIGGIERGETDVRFDGALSW
jgi:phosphoribosylformylglycinamidine cyclo-ligase